MPKLTFVDVWSEVSWKPSYQLVPIFLVKNPSRPICQKVWQLRKNATGKTGGNQHLENRKFQMQHEDMNEGVLLRKIFLVISNRLENPWWIPFKQGSIFFSSSILDWDTWGYQVSYIYIFHMFPYVFTLSSEQKHVSLCILDCGGDLYCWCQKSCTLQVIGPEV